MEVSSAVGFTKLQAKQRAARNIKEGNLDFEFKPEKDDEMGQLCRHLKRCADV